MGTKRQARKFSRSSISESRIVTKNNGQIRIGLLGFRNSFGKSYSHNRIVFQIEISNGIDVPWIFTRSGCIMFHVPSALFEFKKLASVKFRFCWIFKGQTRKQWKSYKFLFTHNYFNETFTRGIKTVYEVLFMRCKATAIMRSNRQIAGATTT